MSDKTTILVVDDDLDLSEMLSAYFTAQNYDVLTAAWGQEALDIANDTPVALVVLDIRLPDFDGYEVCRQLRQQRRTQNVPVIFLTDKRDRGDRLQGLELGVVDYLTKPFDVQELRLRVRNAISRAARQTGANPVTELPENELADEKLDEVLTGDGNRALLLASMQGMGEFRANYGFLAADDVMRAVTLMVKNAVREFGSPDDFIGHISPEDFLIITAPDNADKVRRRIEVRVNQSTEYFYPLRDRESTHHKPEVEYISLMTGILMPGDAVYEDGTALKTALYAAAGIKYVEPPATSE
ncbi:MAG: response regulator [Anaerolineae bacterium]